MQLEIILTKIRQIKEIKYYVLSMFMYSRIYILQTKYEGGKTTGQNG